MIYPYKSGSASAKALAAKLEMRMIKTQNSAFKGRNFKTVINWGSSQLPEEVNKCMILNEDIAVKMASNKLKLFQHIASLTDSGINIPEFTTDQAVAKGWIDAGKEVVVREKLNGHSAEGIVLLDNELDFDAYNHSAAKMYVKYIPKKHEFRVHVVGDKAIDIRRKALRSDFNQSLVNWKIRNHSGGFIFAKEGFTPPPSVAEQAIKAVQASGLDFGAVDIIWNELHKTAYVLEINTAPGLEGSTVDNYAAAFKEILLDEKRAEARAARNKALREARNKLMSQNDLSELFSQLTNPVEVIPEPGVLSVEDTPEATSGSAW